MSEFDDRIFRVELSYGTEQLVLDGGLHISASGTKYANSMQNDCHIKIDNLKKETRDHLGTQLTMFNYGQKRKHVKLFAGRVSTGLFLLYSGDIIECTASQPPDIQLSIKSKTCQFYKMDIISQSQNVTASASNIASGIGQSMGLPVRFEATDKTVQNYSYTGSALKQVDKLNSIGVYDAHIDNDILIVRDRGVPLRNISHVLSMQTGMIGVPELTEYGVRVKCLLTPTIKIGGQLELISLLNPFLNGKYTIYQMSFEVASRDTPFYCIIEASKYPVLYMQSALPQ